METPGKIRRSRSIVLCVLVILAGCLPALEAYSVLSHETIIDAVWDTSLRPLLLKRFPGATHDDLRRAHGFAYGGAIIQDLGYYPYGNKFFSDLTHYVRTGDFIQALLHDSQDLDEYAFALGALAHYAADNQGHRLGTNRAVPLLYPKVAKKVGSVATYEDDKAAHLKTEFGFDVIEVAQGHYAPDAYRDFIGFGVAQGLLERAFQETYGLELKSLLTDEPRAIGSYRHAVSSTIPKATRVAWALKKNEIKKEMPGVTRRRFLYNLSRASYEKNWGKNYHPPTAKEKFLAFLFRLIPKIGPLRALAFRAPTPETERLFEASFNATVSEYQRLLTDMRDEKLKLVNDNFDVGEVTGPGQYWMADETYARLVDYLAQNNYATASTQLRADILRFYADPNAPYATKKRPKEWAKIQKELEQLKGVPPFPAGSSKQAELR